MSTNDTVRTQFNKLLGMTMSSDPELAFPVGADAAEVRLVDQDRIDIAYVAVDPWPSANFWGDNAERGVFRRFRSPGTRSRHLERLATAGAVAFDVVSEDDILVPVLIGSAERTVGVYAMPDDWSQRVRSGALTVADALKEAETTLEAYSSWSDGVICGVVVDRFQVDREAGTVELLESEPQWLQLGPRAAAEHLAEALAALGHPSPRI